MAAPSPDSIPVLVAATPRPHRPPRPGANHRDRTAAGAPFHTPRRIRPLPPAPRPVHPTAGPPNPSHLHPARCRAVPPGDRPASRPESAPAPESTRLPTPNPDDPPLATVAAVPPTSRPATPSTTDASLPSRSSSRTRPARFVAPRPPPPGLPVRPAPIPSPPPRPNPPDHAAGARRRFGRGEPARYRGWRRILAADSGGGL